MSLSARCFGKAALLRQVPFGATRRLPCYRQSRCLGTRGDGDDKKPKIVIQRLGDFPYGSREYKLVLQRPAQEEDPVENDDNESDPASTFVPLASVRAHRNMIFGAQLLNQTSNKRTLSEVCVPLVDAALTDASSNGDQPQALATLHGLCDYVTECLQDDSNPSEALQKLKTEMDDGLLSFHAVQSIATGIPREGHSVVGQGTFRDGEAGWEALAQEFINKKLAEEVELYKAKSGTVVAIEHLADTNPKYLRSAGGAMARLFFV